MNYWQGKRVRLRAVEPDDDAFFGDLNLDSEISRKLDWVYPPSSSVQLRAYTEEMSARKLTNDEFTWIILATDEELQAGVISTHNCHARNGTFNYAVSIMENSRRQGYATEAIGIVLKYYFEELRYEKVITEVHGDNIGSITMHEKLGFVREGTLRSMLYTRGQRHDIYIYGMTADEWRASPQLNP